jgi:Leucine-rich repeat (LRR) protein
MGEIKSLVGIEAFTKLEILNCSGNPLTNLDIFDNTAIEELHCNANTLTSLNISNNVA